MSIFSKDPAGETPLSPYAIERIEEEIAHLRKKYSVRTGQAEKGLSAAKLITAVALVSLLWLFFMDPFMYAFHKSEAMRAYVYLHRAGSEAKAQTLAQSGLFSHYEISQLNHRPMVAGDFDSLQAASATADGVLSYLSSVDKLRSGRYEQLNPIGKLRYLLFVRMGIMPPTEWEPLNPTVDVDPSAPNS